MVSLARKNDHIKSLNLLEYIRESHVSRCHNARAQRIRPTVCETNRRNRLSHVPSAPRTRGNSCP